VGQLEGRREELQVALEELQLVEKAVEEETGKV